MCACVKSSRFPEDMTKDYTVFRNGKELEVCRICGKITGFERKTPIDQRKGYYMGVGQLCVPCTNVYGEEQ